MSSLISYPFPVLGNGDDIQHPAPTFKMIRRITGNVVELELCSAPLITGHQTIDSLVASGDAAWFLRVHCARTYFRKEFLLDPAAPRVAISTDDAEGTATCELFVVATKPLSRYRPDKMHSDYGTAVFDVRSGEILAHVDDFDVNIEPRFDPLQADPRSFVRFEKDESVAAGPFRLDMDTDVLTVFLSRRDWDFVAEMNSRLPSLAHVAIVLPALIVAIKEIDQFSTLRWASRLKALLDANGLSPANPLEAAQRLLDDPLYRGYFGVGRELEAE